MTTETLDPTTLKLRAEHDKMRRLFERFGGVSGEAKKEVAREIMRQLQVQPR